MVNIFEYVDKFFASLQGFDFNYNICFITFIGLFLLTIIFVIIAASHSYEAKLTKSIDMLNNYFMQNPNINEENLLLFNNKMKSKKIPKQLRKQWQQFVLYREGKASEYMSFENCVTKPGKNSSYKRCISVMNILAYVFAICSFVLNLYLSYETNVVVVLQKCVVTPAIILLLNYIVTIFLNFRHNAITSDLNQNYQYFEVNIDKATKTLPDYIDYEVLFDRNEIKKGIPILYTYLQRRAEEEQRELELARLKNVEHEKFNFDEAGIAASLVLERAMQEAENYIAERKKYNQDTEQINTDITQEDMNYREITKEYNRQMQVSKETFANFKSQLEEASSSIEANYIKKQQQQELDRQRNLERDFDTATERHKKIIESYHAELDSVDKFRAQSRKTLEDAMMSEFDTYSSKVYDEVKKVVEEREQEKYAEVQQQIKDLEEKLVLKEQELSNVYSQNQSLNDKLGEMGVSTASIMSAPVEQPAPAEEPVYQEPAEQLEESMLVEETEPVREYKPLVYEPKNYYDDEEPTEQPQDNGANSVDEQLLENQDADWQEEPATEAAEQELENEQPYEVQEQLNEDNQELSEDDWNWDESEEQPEEIKENAEETSEDDDFWNEEDSSLEENPLLNESTDSQSEANETLANEEDDWDWDDFEDYEEGEEEPSNPQASEEEPSNSQESNVEQNATSQVENNISTSQNESESSGVTKRKAGRPRKVVTEEEVKIKRKPGRPKKVKSEEESEKPKRKPGRPKKEVVTQVETVPKKGRGRPKKEVAEAAATVATKKPGRPKKSTEAVAPKAKKAGRPKKNQEASKTVTKSSSPVKKSNTSSKRGRPKKSTQEQFKNIEDIDAYLKEIDNVIAQENAKFEASKKALEKKANLKNKK